VRILRLFYAFLFTEEEVNELMKLQSEFRSALVPARYSSESNLHLTIEFIGEVDRSDLDNYKQVLKEISGNRMDLHSEGCHFFHNHHSGDIFTIKFNLSNDLLSFSNHFRQLLRKHNITYQNKPYIPHITLARKMKLDDESLIDKVNQNKFHFVLKKVALMESTRIDNILTYVELDSITLE